MATATTKRTKPKPVLVPDFCKGCGRCIEACVQHCIELGSEINPKTGLIPVKIHLEECNACGLCIQACPEPYGLMTEDAPAFELADPAKQFGPRPSRPMPMDIPDEQVALPAGHTVMLKGAYAASAGALLAGCRNFFGYPITPSTEGAEYMAKMLPKLGGFFLQAVSEVATVNMMYGCGGAGRPAMTFTSSPGFSLMLEGISYMIGSEIPGVFVNVMRGGPGLGNIAPEQSDVKLVCHGLGHGHTQAIVLAPSTPQEMLDFGRLSFELSFKYRNPVIIVADGYLGQMSGKVVLPRTLTKPGVPSWAVNGDAAHRGNLLSSIQLAEPDLEAHNRHLSEKYARMVATEQRADLYSCEDAEVLLVACNTPGRMAKGAVRTLRTQGVKAGLFRPQTIWPFPVKKLLPLLPRLRQIVVAEASEGQLEDELRLALSHAGATGNIRIDHVRRCGGILPSQAEIVDGTRTILAQKGAAA
jgi:pyruvate/2-oxoacid:ferredoxin oxidoreductase alpha subunit/NAD-dependent dihydropyrimidine dehydrogenase PreA subunit